MATGFRNPNNLPVKDCVVCGRPFTWRKKWENCWDEVSTCSKRCNGERKRLNRIAKGAAIANSGTDASEESGPSSSLATETAATALLLADDVVGDLSPRHQRKKLAKAERRARREGTLPGAGQKACELCAKRVDLLIRCQISSDRAWKLVCGRCWKTPQVAGGVVDGDGSNPHYVYGGLWKNRGA
jgi:hypothetical protein